MFIEVASVAIKDSIPSTVQMFALRTINKKAERKKENFSAF